jgi:UDP-N-acetylmuramyl pentapeptide phosphotransferase/UDP-N-acetylglucosamine-1-phosphate transferase
MSGALFADVALALVLAAAGVLLLRWRASSLPPDVPNARSLHVVPVPRAGGYAVWLGFLPAAILVPPAFPHGVGGWLPPWLALAAISALDDVRDVGIVARLGVQAAAAAWAAAALVSASAAGMPAAPIEFVVIVFAIGWASNLYNFKDGSDGLAASMGAMGFAAYGTGALAQGHAAAATPLFALAAALVPFLVVNRPPARMFLGDVGAVPLGFLASAFGIAGVVHGHWPAWFPLLVFLPFVADASVTLARRMLRRERWWEGHRSHYYQRLAQSGAGHAGTLRVYVALIAGAAATGLACLVAAPETGWWALAAWLAALLIVFGRIDYHWHKKTNMG